MNDDTMENEEGGSLSSYIIVAIIAFALGLGSGYLWASKKAPAVLETKTTDTTESTGTTPTVSGSASDNGDISPTGATISQNAVVAADQAAGVNVMVSQISLDKTAWVVVREDDGAGAPGKILGAQLFDAGTGSGVVELLRGTQIGNTYYVMIYNDNGDRAFDPKSDLPLLGDNGKPRAATFKATDAAGDQTGLPINQ